MTRFQLFLYLYSFDSVSKNGALEWEHVRKDNLWNGKWKWEWHFNGRIAKYAYACVFGWEQWKVIGIGE
jgi:hypothetical protein